MNPSGVVTLIVDQEVSSPAAAAQQPAVLPAPPVQRLHQSDALLLAADGANPDHWSSDGDTIAVGGLIGETTNSVTNGIPLLSRIPYIGGLFGSQTY